MEEKLEIVVLSTIPQPPVLKKLGIRLQCLVLDKAPPLQKPLGHTIPRTSRELMEWATSVNRFFQSNRSCGYLDDTLWRLASQNIVREGILQLKYQLIGKNMNRVVLMLKQNGKVLSYEFPPQRLMLPWYEPQILA